MDWLAAAKRRKAIFLEDSKAKSKRLQQEGAVLAESERFWEAIRYWDEAINLTPASAVLHEMRSQALSELGELFPAVASAERAVRLEPNWSIAWLRLARAQTGIGELEMALSSFQKSYHLDPTDTEAREDILWVQDLLKQKQIMSDKLRVKEEKERNSVLEKRAKMHSKVNYLLKQEEP